MERHRAHRVAAVGVRHTLGSAGLGGLLRSTGVVGLGTGSVGGTVVAGGEAVLRGGLDDGLDGVLAHCFIQQIKAIK